MVRLGDVCEISSSKTNLTDDKIWLLNLDMVEQQTGKIISYYYVNRNELNGSITQFDTENILYSKLRPNLNKVVVPDRNGFSTSELLPLKPNSKILCREYLALYLRSDSFVSWAISKTAGAKMPRLGTKALLDKEIPLPPLDEQRRIAATLDKVTDLISKRRQQLDKLDELVKARFVEMFGGIHDSINFSYLLIKDFTTVVSGGTPERNSPQYWENGTIKWVKTTELQNNIINDTEEKITESGLKNSSAKIVPPNTILVAMYGQGKTRGMTGYLAVEAATNQACACILPSARINQKFLWQYLIMSYNELRNLAKGGNQLNLNGAMIKNFPVLMPPCELQNQFADFVEQTEKAKTTISRSLEKLETMKKALMQEYFG